MKKAVIVIAILFCASLAQAEIHNYTNGNIALDIPQGWEIAEDETGFVAMPEGYNFFVILKPFGQVPEEQLASMLEENLYKIFEYVQFNEEGENAMNGMDTWYGFFTGYLNGQEVGAMASVLNTGLCYTMFLTFGTPDCIDMFSGDIDAIYNSVKPIRAITNR